METLRTDIIVALHTIRSTTRNGFCGRGVSRKREAIATKMVAEHLTLSICRNHRFSMNGEEIEPNRVRAILDEALTALPDELVQAFASKSQLVRHPAGEEICSVLLDKLTSSSTVSYVEPEIRGFSAPG